MKLRLERVRGGVLFEIVLGVMYVQRFEDSSGSGGQISHMGP
jgi:hypothetical protein